MKPSHRTRSVPERQAYRVSKRIFDLTVAALGLLFLSPLLLCLSILIWVRMGKPVLFRQARAGSRGRPFQILKFRTMASILDADGAPLPDAARLTSIGRFMRASSLDELPQLLNILFGDMSLVGPRPLYLHYVDRYSPEQRRRLEVRPGITGLAQVEGRNAISWEERFRLDVAYVDQCSWKLDLSILLRTVYRVCRRQGISQEGHATMEEFQGSQGNQHESA